MEECVPRHERECAGREREVQGVDRRDERDIRILAKECRGERYECEPEEEVHVVPEQHPIGFMEDTEEIVMIHPEYGKREEAEREGEEVRHRPEDAVDHRGGRGVREERNLDFQYEEGQQNGEHTVGKELDALGGRGERRCAVKLCHGGMLQQKCVKCS